MNVEVRLVVALAWRRQQIRLWHSSTRLPTSSHVLFVGLASSLACHGAHASPGSPSTADSCDSAHRVTRQQVRRMMRRWNDDDAAVVFAAESGCDAMGRTRACMAALCPASTNSAQAPWKRGRAVGSGQQCGMRLAGMPIVVDCHHLDVPSACRHLISPATPAVCEL